MSRKCPPEIDKSPGDKNCPSSLSQYSISDIAALVDDQVQDISKPWQGKLMFEVTVVNHDVNINQDLINSTEPVVVNISSYLGGERAILPRDYIFQQPSTHLPFTPQR
jgi:hypothetical protein